MTKKVFIINSKRVERADPLSMFKTASLTTNNNVVYKHIISLEFDIIEETVEVICLDVEDRKRVQLDLTYKVNSGENLKSCKFYPTLKLLFKRENIRKIKFPKYF